MTISFGWSLDLTATSRRLAGILTAGFLGAALVLPGSALAAGPYDPVTDVNSMYNTTTYTGVRAWWAAGYTGAGVDVAVIDTGVSPVEGLATAGKIIYGPDLSLESQASNLTNLDTNGHGTFMAGIIAGRGSNAQPGTYATDMADFLGVAPDARIVSLKVGVADGGVDVSQVIAAIDWVVPLSYAVEQAWKAGIFVVTATGNAGYAFKNGTLTNPAYDPKIFAVGASDSMGTMTTSDDTVPAFSSTGSNSRTPDVVAPGTHIVSLRVPGACT